MTPLDHARMLLQKAAQDEALLAAHLEDATMSAELFGFHSQQAIEKLLKALLAARAVHYPKTHNLERLFAEARERQKHSGHPVVNLQTKRPKA